MIYLIITFLNIAYTQSTPPPPESVLQEEVVQDQVAEQAQQQEQGEQGDEAAALNNPLEGFFEEYEYDPTDKRDPFLAYHEAPDAPQNIVLEPLQKFSLSSLQLVGIIWHVKQPKALFVDSEKRSHVVFENSKIGNNNGYVAAIREGEVVIVESRRDTDGRIQYETQVLKLRKR